MSEIVSIILKLPHVRQECKHDPRFFAPNHYPYYETIVAALKPTVIVEVGARLGFGLVAMLHGNPDIDKVIWVDPEKAIPDSNRMCLENLVSYVRQRPRNKAINLSVYTDAQKLTDHAPLNAATGIVHVDGLTRYEDVLEILRLCSLLRPAYLAVNNYDVYVGVRKAVDEWAVENGFKFVVVDSYSGHAFFDLTEDGDAPRRLEAAGIVISASRRDVSVDVRTVCWCGGELLEYAHVAYGECARCGTLVCRSPASPDRLREFYSFSGYWHTYVNLALGFPTIEERAENDFRDRIPFYFANLNEFKPRAGSLLEIGCGHGGFLHYCRERGIGSVVGIEVDPVTCDFARKRFGLSDIVAGQFPNVDLPLDQFDVIAGFNVVEHVPDPVSTLSRVAELLRPDGVVVFNLPRYFGQGADWNLLVPEHLFLYTAESIQELFRYCGLEAIALRQGFNSDEMCVIGRKRRVLASSGNQIHRPLIGIGLVEHIGDIVATEPIVRYLSHFHPRAKICWVTRRQYVELIGANPHIDEVMPVECVTDWIRMVRHRVFDLAYDLHINGRVCPICRIPLQKTGRCSAINFQNIFSHGSILAGCCKAAGLPPIDETPIVHIAEGAGRRINDLNLPSKFAALHCVSNDPSRTWASNNWARLADFIGSRIGFPIVEIGLSPVLFGERDVRTDTCGLSLGDTAELIRRAACMVCVHSGFAHIANGCKVPAVVLSGKYEHYDYVYPFSGEFAKKNFEYVFNRTGPASELPFDSVADAVSRMLTKLLAA